MLLQFNPINDCQLKIFICIEVKAISSINIFKLAQNMSKNGCYNHCQQQHSNEFLHFKGENLGDIQVVYIVGYIKVRMKSVLKEIK